MTTLLFRRQIRRSLCVALITLLPLAGADAAELAGSWKGVWTKNGDGLPVTVTFVASASGYGGSFSSDELQVADIPLSEVTERNGQVRFVLRGDDSTTEFAGTLSGDMLSGTMEGSDEGTFALTRDALPAAKLQTRDVTFSNKEVQLGGTLIVPASSGKHAAIVFLQGSGPEGRWANRYLAQCFAQAGMVALIYDKRGVGKSTGDWQKVGFEDLARDAVAAVRFLQRQPVVNPERVGIYGHSQGGTIAPLVAVETANLAFVIASAAGGLTPDKVETYSLENSIGITELAHAEQADARAYVQELVDVAYHGKGRSELDRMAERFRTRAWFFPPPPPENSYWAISRQIASYHPAELWARVKAPVLLVYGGNDERIPSMESAKATEDALKAGGNTRVSVKLYPAADHTFTLSSTEKKGGWPKREPDYAAALTKWAQDAAAR